MDTRSKGPGMPGEKDILETHRSHHSPSLPSAGATAENLSNRTPLTLGSLTCPCQTQGSQILSTEWAADLNDLCFSEAPMLEGWGNETIYLCIYPYLPMYLCIHLTLSTCHVAIDDSIICPSIIIFITYHLYIIYHLSIHLSPTYAMSSITYLSSIYHLSIIYVCVCVCKIYLFIYLPGNSLSTDSESP